MAEETKPVPGEWNKKYKLAHGLNEAGIHFVPGFGEVNFSKLTTGEADALVKNGFPHLEKIPGPTAPAAPLLKPAATV